MPHLVILYTANLDRPLDQGGTDMSKLCRTLADTMLAVRDEAGRQVYPTGGTRVLAYPAPHYAVADGQRDYGFAYFNLRMGRGRSDAVKQAAGDALIAAAKAHFQPLFEQGRYIGLTVQIDEGQEVFDAKYSSIHPLFQPPQSKN